MGAALALASRGVGLATPNPSVGCILVKEGRVLGRGWTQAGGRPHAEAMALAEAGAAARGATCYVTLEPCAHASPRGRPCADSLIEAGVKRVVIAAHDPDPRTNGDGAARLTAAGIAVTGGLRAAEAEAGLAGFLTRLRLGRPHITLKLAVSLDGAIAMADGRSQWITGERARAAAHLARARSDLIVVGRGTWEADAPRLDVRLPGLEDRSPRIGVVGRAIGLPAHVAQFPDLAALIADPALGVLVEGGMGLAASLLAADLVDALLLMRAPILIGGGRTLGDIGLADLAQAHGRWQADGAMALGPDRIERYTRIR
ncbi:bifunctional diaminohydroxyphosphoribosylaminopyrimidine deaminase/5-amino-6-(5-phosphoribosylamino)uracil reductase RibD [Sandarakinorhabdus rubra]|uniref:bifunctional diaminohydroxyphosphoribosylaminopyrimidine deaminase/5-amino-6-(5-phosphoribosylamino)uracil reductase RibD n=1 Tax=Sandarakinorhabdus rubra TaxID=2672568 RepID=UPI0013DD707E|nr:bifunctional diaminohydroxyphosphoribosylaminopyrimidine deaminase/5-amino-6-(5-phosphoribosylamino)uracil reductase RibD [Sandarakinorhabdus rubra]